jgi:hypothetical protein
MPETEGVPNASAATAESGALADNIINFPSTDIAFDVGSALDEVMEAYDKRREMVAVAFKIANLSSAQLKARFARATPGSVEALSDLLWKDTEAFIALTEMLVDVRDRVEAARRNRI